MNAFSINKIEAIQLFQAGKYVKAIKYFTDALQVYPTNVECLIKRSICYLNDGLIEKAFIDANLAVSVEPKNQKAIYQKAEVYYIRGEFEKSLLLYQNGKALRPDDEKFRLGIQRSEMAISNCLGEGSSYHINAAEEHRNVLIPGAGEGMISSKSELKSVNTMKELLNELSSDRFYLNDIIKEEGLRINKFKEIIPFANIKRKLGIRKDYGRDYYGRTAFKQNFSSIKIKQVAIHCTNYLDPRSDFWQQYQPFYSRKSRNSQVKVKIPSILKDKPKWTAHNVLLELVHIEMLGFQGDYWQAIEKAKTIINVLDEVRDIKGQNYHIILSDLYSIIGNSYFKILNYKEALKYHELDRVNGLTNNIKDAVSRSMDYLGMIHFIQNEYHIAIKIWSNKIKFAVSNLELSWLYHELGRSYLALENYESALKYASKSLEKANEGMNENWQMNAHILMGKALHHLYRIPQSMEEYMKASELSKVLKLYGVEEEINKLIQQNTLKSRLNERTSMARLHESIKLGSIRDGSLKHLSTVERNSKLIQKPHYLEKLEENDVLDTISSYKENGEMEFSETENNTTDLDINEDNTSDKIS